MIIHKPFPALLLIEAGPTCFEEEWSDIFHHYTDKLPVQLSTNAIVHELELDGLTIPKGSWSAFFQRLEKYGFVRKIASGRGRAQSVWELRKL